VLVGVVREVVRDLIADCVATLIARIPQWLAEIAGTLGIATPHVVASAVTLISRWVARISDVIQKLVRSINNLRPLLRRLDEIWAAIRNGLRGLIPGGPSTPNTPGSTTPGSTTAPNPSGVDTPTVSSSPTTPSSTTPAGTTPPVSQSPTVSPASPSTPSSTTPAGTTPTATPAPTVAPSAPSTPTTPRTSPTPTTPTAAPTVAPSGPATPSPSSTPTPAATTPTAAPTVAPSGPSAPAGPSSPGGGTSPAFTTPNSTSPTTSPTSPSTSPGATPTPGGVSPGTSPGSTTPGGTGPGTPDGSTPGGTGPDGSTPGNGGDGTGGPNDPDTPNDPDAPRDPDDPFPSSQTDPSFESRLDEVLDQHGITREEFHDLASRSADDLTPEQARIVHDVRHAVELNPDTVVSKVLPEDIARNYLANATDGFNPNTVGGFFARHGDVADFNTPGGMFEGLALNYNNTPFTPGDERIFSIRFEAGSTGDYSIPFGGNDPNSSTMTGFGGGSSGVNERPSFNPPPFTGTGFTASGDHTVPEFTRNPRAEIPEGAAIYETNAAGQERVVGIYGGPDVGWIPVNGGIQ
ncbi:MAG TPA: hypothetical protein VGD67_21300, partial [Pseudonocardiaceae bacterium]